MASSFTPRGDPFPKKPEEFHLDARCTYSNSEEKWVLTDASGSDWEWNTVTNKWFQPATAEEIAAYQQGYGGSVQDGEAQDPDENKKRKQASKAADAGIKKTKTKPKAKAQENRAIYVTNLPLDATKEEIAMEFCKWGIIDEGTDGEQRIKMYTNEEGKFKGEALIVYFRKDSVSMAIQMADDSWFRPGDTQMIHVQEADPSFKKHQDGDEVKLVRKDRKANDRNRAELNRKLTEWSDDDDATKEALAPRVNKWAKIIIMTHMFTLEELEKDPAALLEIKEEVREEAAEFGEVTNVVLYDKEADGIMSVKFKELKEAEAFRNKCDGRKFDGRTVKAWHSEDKPKFKKSKVTDEEELSE